MTLAAALAALAAIDVRFPVVEGNVRVEAAIAPPPDLLGAPRAHGAAIRALPTLIPPDRGDAPAVYSAARLHRIVRADARRRRRRSAAPTPLRPLLTSPWAPARCVGQLRHYRATGTA